MRTCRLSRVLVMVATGAMLLSSCSSGGRLDDPAATGRELVSEFLTILSTEEAPGLEDFLADGFQLQRADGSGGTKAEYLETHAVVESFVLGESLTAVQQGDLLTVRWSVEVDESVGGTDFSSDEAPRLSVFVREGGDWKLLAHANFNRPT